MEDGPVAAPVPCLTDGIVLLNALGSGDVEAHWQGEDEEQARRFGWYPQRSPLAHVAASIEEWRRQWEISGPIRTFAVRDAASGVLVGGCQIRLKTADLAQMSYWTFALHRRQGYATRALRLGVAFAFEVLGVKRVELEIEPDNEPSRRVAQSAGFIEQGIFRYKVDGHECDMVHDVLERPASRAMS